MRRREPQSKVAEWRFQDRSCPCSLGRHLQWLALGHRGYTDHDCEVMHGLPEFVQAEARPFVTVTVRDPQICTAPMALPPQVETYAPVLAVVLPLALRLWKYNRLLGQLLLTVLTLQLVLGVLNVVWNLPLAVATAHNGVGALLLLAVVTVNFAPRLRFV